MSAVAAIILAAGRGTRFGSEPKLLALLDGKPLIRHAAEAALASRARPVIVVTGHREVEVAAALGGLDLTIVPNRLFAAGQATSLRAGFAALPPDSEAAIVLLGDMPRVGASLIDRLLRRWIADRPAAVIPVSAGRRGNPVVLSRLLEREIASLAGDTGAGPLLKDREGVIEEPVTDEAALQDVDTQEALAALGGS